MLPPMALARLESRHGSLRPSQTSTGELGHRMPGDVNGQYQLRISSAEEQTRHQHPEDDGSFTCVACAAPENDRRHLDNCCAGPAASSVRIERTYRRRRGQPRPRR